jgi:hypothetical protein
MNGQADFLGWCWISLPQGRSVMHENEAIGATVQYTVQYINILFSVILILNRKIMASRKMTTQRQRIFLRRQHGTLYLVQMASS